MAICMNWAWSAYGGTVPQTALDRRSCRFNLSRYDGMQQWQIAKIIRCRRQVSK
jgi:hypothetical protein